MGVAGFGDPALGALAPLECSDGTRPTKAISLGAVGKAPRIAELGRNGQGGEVVDPAEAAQARDARPQRLQVEQGAQILLDGRAGGPGFVDGAEIGPMRLVEGGQRPRLGAEPGVVALGPGLLGAGEAAAVAEQEFGEPMTRAEQIGADVFATPQQIARGFFLLGRNVDGGQRPRAVEHRELAGVAAIRFDAIARSARDQRRRNHVAGDPVAPSGRAAARSRTGPAS